MIRRPSGRHAPGHATDDAGTVAVVVALTVALVLIPVAALAVDLGTVYVRAGDSQVVADRAARAGAVELARLQRDDVPSATVMTTAREAAVADLCAAAAGAGWDDACAGTRDWAANGDPADGEVSFYTGAPLADGGFTADQDASDAAANDLVSGIRVVTPPQRVTFGLAGSFTADHTDLQRSATAGLFTVLPRAGVFPMFLRPGEAGGFCTRSAPQSVWYPTAPHGCTSVARGNLAAARTNSTENAAAMVWNAATGFDRAHLPLPGGVATFQVQNPTSSLVRELSPGLFGGTGSAGAPPRLKGGTCPGAYSTTSGPFSGLESAYLTDLLNTTVGDKFAFRALVKAGSAPTQAQRGWLDARVLGCGRLAVVPVLGDVYRTVPNPLPTDGLTSSQLTYPVSYLRLIWLDDRLWAGEATDQRVASGACLHRGFFWADEYYETVCEQALRAYTGYILDPRLLPATVGDSGGANALDRYIGYQLPVVVRLLRDVADPPAR